MTFNYDTANKQLLFRVRPTDTTDVVDLTLPPPYLLPMKPVATADALTAPTTIGHGVLHLNTSLRSLVLLSRHAAAETTRLVVPPEFHASMNVVTAAGTMLTPLIGPGMTVNYNTVSDNLVFRVRPTDATDVVDCPLPAPNTLNVKWIGTNADATLPASTGFVTTGYNTTLQSLVLQSKRSTTEYGPAPTVVGPGARSDGGAPGV